MITNLDPSASIHSSTTYTAPSGLSLGYPALDHLLGSVRPGQIIALAGRPSVGISSLALNIAERVAVNQGIPVGVFNLEFAEDQWTERLLCFRAKVDAHRAHTGELTAADMARLHAAAEEIRRAPLYLNARFDLNLPSLEVFAREMSRLHGARLFVVDCLQRLHPQNPQVFATDEETAHVCGALRALAAELAVPFLVLTRLDRDPATKDRLPSLEDLGHEDGVAEHADTVLLLHRPELPEMEGHPQELSHEATLIVAKQPSGALGKVELTFHAELCRFEERP